MRRFCREHDLSEPSFYAWRRTLKLREATAQQPEFVPLKMTMMLPTSSGLVVELRGGRKLHLPLAMPTEQVVAILHGLEASEVVS